MDGLDRISGFVGAHGLFKGLKRTTPVLLSRFVAALTGHWVGFEGEPGEEGEGPGKVEAHHGDGQMLHNCWVTVRALPPDIHEGITSRVDAVKNAGGDLISDPEKWLESRNDPRSSRILVQDPHLKRQLPFKATISDDPNFIGLQAAHVRILIRAGVFGGLAPGSDSPPMLSEGLRTIAASIPKAATRPACSRQFSASTRAMLSSYGPRCSKRHEPPRLFHASMTNLGAATG